MILVWYYVVGERLNLKLWLIHMLTLKWFLPERDFHNSLERNHFVKENVLNQITNKKSEG